jgi:phosphopantothenoylcysteine decarboxylase
MVSGVLYIVASAAPPVERISVLIAASRRRGWDACLILTPSAAQWLAHELPGLAAQTGHPVRSEYKMPGAEDVLPPADAMAVVPATFTTINKWAAGISDTLALGLINEAIGLGIPIVTVPVVNDALAAHPAWAASVATLRGAGVTVLDVRSAPLAAEFPWDQILDAFIR